MIKDIFQTTLPETILVIGLILFPLCEIFRLKCEKLASLLWGGIVLTAVLSCLYLSWGGIGINTAFSGHFILSSDLIKIKMLLLVLALPAGIIGEKYFMNPNKYYLLLLSTLYGALLLISSGSFITLFMGLELMNIPLYALILNGPQKEKAYEASMKYLFIDGIVTASFLMGLALLYFDTGAMILDQGPNLMTGIHAHAQFGYLVMILALFTKMTLAPFHFWAPDVNEGSSWRVLYILSSLPKLALAFVLSKMFVGLLNGPAWQGVLIGLALLSIFWGNIATYKQTSLKRFLAYSSVAQMGYLLLVYLVPQAEQLFLISLFFMLYVPLLFLLIFAAQKIFAIDDQLLELENLATSKPFLALPLLFSFLSFAGIPPFPGFFAKITIMFSVMKSGFAPVAVLAFVGSYLGIYAYFRLIVSLYLKKKNL